MKRSPPLPANFLGNPIDSYSLIDQSRSMDDKSITLRRFHTPCKVVLTHCMDPLVCSRFFQIFIKENPQWALENRFFQSVEKYPHFERWDFKCLHEYETLCVFQQCKAILEKL